MFSTSALITFTIGFASVLFILVFRYIMIKNTLLAELGPGFISLSDPNINGYDPNILYRVMHNLTTIWSLTSYFVLTSIATFILTQIQWELSKIKMCHFVLSMIHLIFAVLFSISLFLPIGDMVTHLAK